jgi:uncharacterized membrane protein YfcA
LLDIIIILIIIGLAAGAIGSLIGIGGGIIIGPALAFMGFSPSHIASTSLIAVTSTSASSTIVYSKQKTIDYATGLKISTSSIPGGIAGAFLSSEISLEYFKVYFAIILMLIGVYIVYKNSIIKEKTSGNSKSIYFYILFYSGTFSAGIISSLFGVGGGIIFVPMMVIILRMKMLKASPTSQLILLMTSLAGMFTHVILGHPDYNQSIALVVGSFIGAQIGSRLLPYAKESILQKLLFISLLAVAAKLIFDSVYKP